jgi:hypothetical protein
MSSFFFLPPTAEPGARVQASADISQEPISLVWSENLWNGDISVEQIKTQTSQLTDGFYTVTGSLGTTVTRGGPTPLIVHSLDLPRLPYHLGWKSVSQQPLSLNRRPSSS